MCRRLGRISFAEHSLDSVLNRVTSGELRRP
jgi:hypothetical protein